MKLNCVKLKMDSAPPCPEDIHAYYPHLNNMPQQGQTATPANNTMLMRRPIIITDARKMIELCTRMYRTIKNNSCILINNNIINLNGSMFAVYG